MKADSLNAKDLFGKQVCYVIPAFQRPYVWTKDDQWEPMWEDVQDAAERYLEAMTDAGPDGPAAAAEAAAGRHFMGAVVVKQVPTPAAAIETREVIDGQQRMTTLQILLDAAQEVAEEEQWDDLAYNLRHLVRNDEHFAKKDPEKALKVLPTLQDRAAFEVAMTNGVPAGVHSGSAIVQCHEYFQLRIRDWINQVGDDERLGRANALETALVGLLELVVIDLGDSDDAFVIFETLNARGTPLRPSDLVKNFLLQAADALGGDPDEVSAEYWAQFNSEWWQKEVRQGRLRRHRVDTFLDYWLEARTREEVKSHEVFPTFKAEVDKSPGEALGLAQEMKDAASVYKRIEELDRYTRDGTFVHRWHVLDAGVLTPLLLWVFSLDASVLAPERRTRLLVALESYLVRRMVNRMTTKQYNRLFLDALDRGLDGPAESADDTVIDFLAGQTSDSTVWPRDEALRSAFIDLPVYRLLSRSRLEMVLKAVEDDMRDPKTEDEFVTRKKLTIEHVLPQSWSAHWPLPGVEDELREQIERDRVLHTLGNLTLLTSSLNSGVSNAGWTTKRAALAEHSNLQLTKPIIWVKPAGSDEPVPRPTWDEASIRSRSESLADRATKIWPRP